jgi:hypothetical protein
VFKQDVSPFADRRLFRKGSGLGVRGQRKPAAGSRITESGGAAQKRFWNTRRTKTFPRLPNVGPETVRM